MYHLVQIEDVSDDPREFQQHVPRGGFIDDEMPPSLGSMLGARFVMHAAQDRILLGENALSCIVGRSSTPFTCFPPWPRWWNGLLIFYSYFMRTSSYCE